MAHLRANDKVRRQDKQQNYRSKKNLTYEKKRFHNYLKAMYKYHQ